MRYLSLLVLLLTIGPIGRVVMAEPLPFAGIWQGTSGGDDRMTWTARVDGDGQIRAAGISRDAGSFTATGFVTAAGVLTLEVAGRTSTPPTFRGTITSNNRVVGAWENRGLVGCSPAGAPTPNRSPASASSHLVLIGHRQPATARLTTRWTKPSH